MATPTTPSTPVAPSWTIAYQRETTLPSPAGGFQTGVTIGFTTNHGVTQSIFVPYTSYTPDFVREAIAARVALIDAVHNLAG